MDEQRPYATKWMSQGTGGYCLGAAIAMATDDTTLFPRYRKWFDKWETVLSTGSLYGWDYPDREKLCVMRGKSLEAEFPGWLSEPDWQAMQRGRWLSLPELIGKAADLLVRQKVGDWDLSGRGVIYLLNGLVLGRHAAAFEDGAIFDSAKQETAIGWMADFYFYQTMYVIEDVIHVPGRPRNLEELNK